VISYSSNYATFHGGIIGWLLRVTVMASCAHRHRNVAVWLCCSRLSSHTYEIVTEWTPVADWIEERLPLLVMWQLI